PDVGGMSDFRLDFAASCLFGALLCVAVRSAFFRDTRWTLLFGVTAGALILTRTIYLAYLTPSMVLMRGLTLARWTRDPRGTPARVLNLAVAGATLVLVVLPSLLARWDRINTYYVAGHRSEEATMRAREFGVLTSLDHLTYYARSAISAHAGLPFLALGAIV